MKILVFILMIASIQVYAQEWQNNLEETLEQSEKQNKLTILVFSGSDWCSPCIKLDKQIFQSVEFVKFSAKEANLVKVDFPKHKKNQLQKEQQVYNEELAMKYNPEGVFPFVVIFNKNGKIVKHLGFEKKSPKEYIKLIKMYTK